MARFARKHCVHPGCSEVPLTHGLCAVHAAALRNRNHPNNDPLRLLYFGTYRDQPWTHARLPTEIHRLRQWWFDACVAAQSVREGEPMGVAEAAMEWCLVIAAQICVMEDRYRCGLADDPAETVKTEMFWRRLEVVGAELRGPGPGNSIH